MKLNTWFFSSPGFVVRSKPGAGDLLCFLFFLDFFFFLGALSVAPPGSCISDSSGNDGDELLVWELDGDMLSASTFPGPCTDDVGMKSVPQLESDVLAASTFPDDVGMKSVGVCPCSSLLSFCGVSASTLLDSLDDGGVTALDMCGCLGHRCCCEVPEEGGQPGRVLSHANSRLCNYGQLPS